MRQALLLKLINSFFVTASIQPDDPESGKSMQKAFGPNLDEFKATSFCIGSYQGSCSGWAPASVFGTLSIYTCL